MEVLMIMMIGAPADWATDRVPRNVTIEKTNIQTCINVKREYSQKYIDVKCIKIVKNKRD